MSDEIGISNAADDPAKLKLMMDIIALFRMATAPSLHAAQDSEDEFGDLQSAIISASVVMAGMTVGHMTVAGAIDPAKGDVERSKSMLSPLFDFGFEQGRIEAQNAVVAAGLAGTS